MNSQKPSENNTPGNSNETSENNTFGNIITEYPGYPECPESVEIKKSEPIFVPITVEVCPIVNLKINPPKICLQNQALTKPVFFLD